MTDLVTTLFFDNLPISIRKIWLHNLFSRFGKIRDIFIPNKRSRITNNQFGFVRFFYKTEANAAARNTNGFWFWNQKLVVHTAKFSARKYQTPNSWFGKQTHQKFNQTLKSKWVYKVKNPKKPNAQAKPNKDVWVPKVVSPSISSNGNPEIQTFIGAGRYNIHHIHIQPTGNGWLMRSVVAKIRKLLSPNDLIRVFSMENTPVDHIKSIGGRYVIITFPSPEVRDEIMKEEWLSIWFEKISPWSGEAAKEERFAWLSCYGMPLNGWTVPNFKLIGDLWGDFIKTDDTTLHGESFARGRTTEQIQKITGSIDMEVCGIKYSVRVEEDDSFRTIKSNSFPPFSHDFNVSNEDGKATVFSSKMDHFDNSVDAAQLCNIITANKEEDERREMRNKEEVDLRNNDLASNTMERNDVACLLNRVEKVVEETEVVDETPSTLIDEMVAAKNKLQLVVFKPPSWRWFCLEQSENVVGNAKVVSPTINDIQISSTPISQNCSNDISASRISSSKINNLVENNYSESDQFSTWSELPFNRKLAGPSKKKAAAEKIKKRKKSIEELIGIPKIKRGGRKSKKGTLVRSAIASAALSISSEGIRNRNRIILDEEEAARTISNIIGEDYLGNDKEVISKFMITNS